MLESLHTESLGIVFGAIKAGDDRGSNAENLNGGLGVYEAFGQGR